MNEVNQRYRVSRMNVIWMSHCNVIRTQNKIKNGSGTQESIFSTLFSLVSYMILIIIRNPLTVIYLWLYQKFFKQNYSVGMSGAWLMSSISYLSGSFMLHPRKVMLHYSVSSIIRFTKIEAFCILFMNFSTF